MTAIPPMTLDEQEYQFVLPRLSPPLMWRDSRSRRECLYITPDREPYFYPAIPIPIRPPIGAVAQATASMQSDQRPGLPTAVPGSPKAEKHLGSPTLLAR